MSKKGENPDLQKQMGCISGFFQLFGRRQWFLTGETSNEVKQRTSNNTMQKAKAKNVKVARENQFSTESSSGTCMSSSSCSSSMSSLEFNRTIQIVEAPPSISQIKIVENSNSGAALKQLDTPGHQSLDFHDIVKDSMQREAQGLSVKTVAKEEKKGRILRRIDSPRPQKAPWDSPRHSYDGRDVQQIFRCTTKHKEIPRLSLDSRVGSLKGFNETTKSCNLSKDAQKGYGSTSTMLRQQQEPETSRRPSSVVAKLMGLEAFPDWTQTCDTPPPSASSRSTNRDETFAKSSQDSQLQESKGSESSIKTSSPSLSVYGEIERRMADLQFKNSGKDLRALKQILEAMQRCKDSLDTTTRDQAYRSLSEIQQKDSTSTEETSNSTQGSKLPIVIMKPAHVTRKTNNPTNGRLVEKLDKQTARGSTPPIKHQKDPFSQPFHSVDKSNKMRTSKSMQFSKVQVITNGENTTNSSHIAESRSPRVQKKFGLERRSPTRPSSDSRSNRRQTKQLLELSSPSTTPRQRISTLQQRNELFSRISCQQRDFKHEVDVISSDFDSNRSMDSHSDIEAFQVDHYEKSNYIQLNDLNQDNAEKELSKESFMAETIVTAEQPSPVSVLDAAFYNEEPPSPVKTKSHISKDLDEALNAYDSSEDISDLPSNTTKTNFRNENSDNDFQTQNFVQTLQQVDYNDEKLTSFTESKDLDRKYISEILVASRLLSSPNSSHVVHSPGHPISPKLFLALEQIKTNKMQFSIENNAQKIFRKNNPEKMQRKLIFDVVNDILLQKLTLESSSTLLCLPNEPAGCKLNGQQLLDELCREIEKIQYKSRNVDLANEDENLTSLLWGDLMHQSAIWTECNGEIPNVVLDIERLIFKDLITEVVT